MDYQIHHDPTKPPGTAVFHFKKKAQFMTGLGIIYQKDNHEKYI
jgi:hypothetical protein